MYPLFLLAHLLKHFLKVFIYFLIVFLINEVALELRILELLQKESYFSI